MKIKELKKKRNQFIKLLKKSGGFLFLDKLPQIVWFDGKGKNIGDENNGINL